MYNNFIQCKFHYIYVFKSLNKFYEIDSYFFFNRNNMKLYSLEMNPPNQNLQLHWKCNWGYKTKIIFSYEIAITLLQLQSSHSLRHYVSFLPLNALSKYRSQHFPLVFDYPLRFIQNWFLDYKGRKIKKDFTISVVEFTFNFSLWE